MADTIVITKTQEDVVLVNNGGIEYTLDPRYRVQKKDGNVQILTDLGGLIETFDPAEVEKVVLKDTSEVLIPDQDTLFTQLITNFFFESKGLNGASFTTSIVRSADKSILNSIAMTPDGELEFAIGAAESWIFNMILVASELGANPNIKFRLGAFDGLTGDIEYSISNIETSGEAEHLSDFTTISVGFSLTGVKRLIKIEGSLTSINSGTLKLEWAQNSSDSDATTIHKNSALTAVKSL